MNTLRDPLDLLRSLDPAPDHVDTAAPRARADLERILATDPGSDPAATDARRTSPRLAAAAAAVLVIGAGVALVPSLTGSDPAYATWTAAPTKVSGSALPGVADACRDAQAGGAGSDHRRELAASTAAVAERRGAWTLVLLSGDDGFSALCITDESRPLFRSSFGYVGATPDSAAGAERPIRADTLGVGSIDGRELSVAVGTVSDDVSAVTYTSAEYGAVAASVSGGHFAFWLPGDELTDASQDGVEVELTRRDGTTETHLVTLG